MQNPVVLSGFSGDDASLATHGEDHVNLFYTAGQPACLLVSESGHSTFVIADVRASNNRNNQSSVSLQ